MTKRQPRYDPEEHARRGDDIYERSVRPQVEAGNRGRIVAIDIDSGAFEGGRRCANGFGPPAGPLSELADVVCPHWDRAVHRFGPRTVPEMT